MSKRIKALKRTKQELEAAYSRCRTLEEIQGTLQARVDAHAERIDELVIQLNEARRRTIPIGDGSLEINFLPIAVLEYTTDHQTCELRSLSGMTERVHVGSRFVIKVLADMVENPPVIHQTGKPK